jgi:hypothetical protein
VRPHILTSDLVGRRLPPPNVRRPLMEAIHYRVHGLILLRITICVIYEVLRLLGTRDGECILDKNLIDDMCKFESH